MPGLHYPILVDATGHCPPEDVGGPWGYRNLLEILADPGRQRYTEMMEWIGGTFDPRTLKIEDLAKAVNALARKWAPKPEVKRKPPKITRGLRRMGSLVATLAATLRALSDVAES